MNTMIYYIPAVLTREMSFPVLMAWCASTAPVVEKVQQLPHAPYPQKGGGREEGEEEEGKEGGEGGGEGEGGKGGWEKGEGNGRSMPVALTEIMSHISPHLATPITHTKSYHTPYHTQHTPHHICTSRNKPHLVPSSHTAQQMSVNSSATYVRTYVHT